MTEREAFKFGFLLRCADEGLSPPQLQARIKLAEGWLSGATNLGLGAAGLGLAASAGLGAGAGYLTARATEPDVDPEEAKMQELIAAYKQQADQARRTASRIGYRMQTLRPRGRGTQPVAA